MVGHCRASKDSRLQELVQRADKATGATLMEKRPVPYEEDPDVKLGPGAAAKGWSITVTGYRCGQPVVKP